MNVLIYSENRLFGECLERGLSREKDVTRVVFASDIPRLAELNSECPGSAILVDLSSIDGPVVVEALMACAPDACFVALGVDEADGEALLDCARLGFAGVAPTGTALSELSGIIRSACRGEVKLAPRAAAGLFQKLHTSLGPRTVEDWPEVETLTRREREVCGLVCDGLSNKEIANELNRSIGTVKNHVHAILEKLEVPRRGAIPGRVMRAEPSGAPWRNSGACSRGEHRFELRYPSQKR
ncbi:Transcriptional regulatory protein DesR [Defluviimonas aquaemixtae]|uniref:Transcriptional regulatory protein DesR n=1 Tax=Albidovulum aquaemixtae TaxID=1542388 RepID=A0A2R8BKR1_9RHOB|nr:response regulator transcription factor [Defluviimonas aquaemixtae]SPH23958.1 Transcriptional regulatory protein DesR [Defluviimonas aquaemixtae]